MLDSEGERFVKRYKEPLQLLGPIELHLTERGSMDNLELRMCKKYEDKSLGITLSDEEVEVQVCATSLNFRVTSSELI